MTKVSIVIPAYNEEAAIVSVVRGLKQAFSDADIVVVDDGSTDNTAQLAEKEGAKVITHTKNIGQGGSMKTGARICESDYILYCDADGQHSAEDVKKIYNECINGEYDLIIGARGKGSHSPMNRRAGKFVLQIFANYLAGEEILDLNSGLRAFKRQVLLRYLHLLPDQFSFSTTSTFAMMKTNQRIKYIPIIASERIGISTVRQIQHGSEALLLMLRLAVLFEPLKVFLHVSGILFILSLISLGIDIYYDIITQNIGIGQATILLFISTLIVFLFGLVCDQVSAIRRSEHEIF